MQKEPNKNPAVSIVMTHFNRAHLLRRTLHSFTYNQSRDFEIVIVDDASNNVEYEKLLNLIHEYSDEFNIVLYNINEHNKWYDNPCIPFNIALKEAIGDIIIIQNPECMHLGNVIDYVIKRKDMIEPDPNCERPNDRRYFSFACYNIDQVQTEALTDKPTPEEVLKLINPVNNNPITHCEEPGWYDHSKFRPLGYHWCNAIANEDLKRLKYFDERFSKGIAYDDDEFAFRTKKLLHTIDVDSPLVIHQWHGLYNYYKNKNQVENQMKQDYNLGLLKDITKVESMHGPNFENVVNHLSEKVTYNRYYDDHRYM